MLLCDHLRAMERAAREDSDEPAAASAASAPTAEWEVGYRFFVKGQYGTYGNVEVKGAPAAINVSWWDGSVDFVRGATRLCAEARSVRCFGACHAPEDRTQKFRMCIDGLRGKTIYTELPVKASASTVPPLAYTADEVGAMVAEFSLSYPSWGTEKRMRVEQYGYAPPGYAPPRSPAPSAPSTAPPALPARVCRSCRPDRCLCSSWQPTPLRRPRRAPQRRSHVIGCAGPHKRQCIAMSRACAQLKSPPELAHVYTHT